MEIICIDACDYDSIDIHAVGDAIKSALGESGSKACVCDLTMNDVITETRFVELMLNYSKKLYEFYDMPCDYLIILGGHYHDFLLFSYRRYCQDMDKWSCIGINNFVDKGVKIITRDTLEYMNRLLDLLSAMENKHLPSNVSNIETFVLIGENDEDKKYSSFVDLITGSPNMIFDGIVEAALRSPKFEHPIPDNNIHEMCFRYLLNVHPIKITSCQQPIDAFNEVPNAISK